MVRFFLGFGVVPGDIFDGAIIDSGIVVSGVSEGERIQSAYKMAVGSD